MSIIFNDYRGERRIVTLAFNEEIKNRAIDDNLSVLFVDSESIVLFPEKLTLSTNRNDVEHINNFNNYDVFTIREDGMLIRRYDTSSDDNYFFITGKCNSNCIMCPSSESSRQNASEFGIEELIELARYIPDDAYHLTITGGEPFLLGKELFSFIRCLKERFPVTEFLFLTNGRVFALPEYVQLLKENMPSNTILAIPLHGSSEEVHDLITRVDGSFKQTIYGVKQLLNSGIRVEIRLVVNKLNVSDFDNIADLIIAQFKKVDYVSVIAMEMTGNAWKNREQVWIPYKESFSMISGSLYKMIQNGINVRLYNYPICAVERPFWTLCEKSISASKVRYADVCEECKYKSACGGVFAGTYRLEKDEMRALK